LEESNAFCLLHDGDRSAPLDGSASLEGPGCTRRRSRDRRLSPRLARAERRHITPPPGVYFQNDTYSGKIGGGTTLPTGGLSGFFLNSF
jgi:hypothetical protein